MDVKSEANGSKRLHIFRLLGTPFVNPCQEDSLKADKRSSAAIDIAPAMEMPCTTGFAGDYLRHYS